MLFFSINLETVFIAIRFGRGICKSIEILYYVGLCKSRKVAKSRKLQKVQTFKTIIFWEFTGLIG